MQEILIKDPMHAVGVDKQTLSNALRSTAENHPRQTVEWIDDNQHRTVIEYARLLNRAEVVAAALRDVGLTPGTSAFLPIAPAFDFFTAFWACILSGIVAVPIPVPLSIKRRNSALDRLAASWSTVPDAPVVCTLDSRESLARVAALYDMPQRRFIVPPAATAAHSTAANAFIHHEAPAESPAVMMLTSGSTGRPKGVPLSHANIIARSLGTAALNRFTADEVSYNWFPFDHVGSLVMFHVRDVILGCHQIHASTQGVLEDPLRWFDQCDELGVTATWAPNFAFGLINARAAEVAERSWNLERLRFIMNAGEAVVPRTARRFLEIMTPHGLPPTAMIPAWGMSETSSAVLFNTELQMETTSDEDTSASVGQPISGTEVRIVDERDRPVPDGTVGQLQVRGPTCLRQYYNAPDKTAEAFTDDGWFRTGDEACRNHGRVTITGRKKDEIVVRGVNHPVHDIEAAVEETPGVRTSFAAACQIVDAESGAEELAIFFSPQRLDAPVQPVADDIRNRLVSRLGIRPAYVVPLAPEDMPKTSIGKIQRSALRQKFEAGELPVLPMQQAATPEAGIEPEKIEDDETVLGRVRAICREALDVPMIASTDDIFSMGGDSLRAAAILARLRKQFGIGPTLHELFDDPTPAGLARAVEQAMATQDDREENAALAFQPRTVGESEFPLSFPQERVWFLDRWQPGNPAYIELLRYDIEGKIDPERLRRSFDNLVARHEILRTTFPMRDGRPVQRVHETLPYEFDTLDWSARQDAELALADIEQSISHQAFDLESGPCFRCRLVHLAPERATFLLCIHHLLVDAWSLGVIMNELRTGYEPDNALPPLEIQYADFARRQRASILRPGYEKQLYYWQTRLAGLEAVTEFPADHPRPAHQTFSGCRRYRRLPSELADAVKRVAADQGATPFMVMLSVFHVLLHRYTGVRDIILGSPVIHRDDVALEPLIGFFANTLVFRCELDPVTSFADHVRRVREMVLEGVANQDVPFERLVEELGVERDLSRTPLIQILFQAIDYPSPVGDDPRLTYREHDNRTAKFDLTMQVAATPGNLECMCEFNTDLYEESTITRMLGHFENLLQRAVNQPEQPIRNIKMLGDAEETAILKAGRGPDTNWLPDLCMHEIVAAHARQRPDSMAVRSDAESLSYAELDRRANHLAATLESRGVAPGDVVALFLDRGPSMFVAMLGVLKTGAAYLPIDPIYPDDRIQYMLGDAACALVVAGRGLTTRFQAPCPVLALDSVNDRDESAPPRQQPNVSAEALAYIIYTSGSTGRPKGVCVRHRNVVHLIQTASAVMPFDASDTWSVYHSYAFDFSVWEIWSPLLSGGAVVPVSDEDAHNPRHLARLLERHGVTILNITPSALRPVVDMFPDGLDAEGVPLRSMVVGGEAFPVELAKRVLNWNTPIYNFYGPTECTVWAAAQRVEADSLEDAGGVVPLGYPLPDSQLHVLDAYGHLLPIGVAGELHIGGKGVAAGYHHRPELTDERFVPNPFATDTAERMYRTGDRGRQRPDGVFVFDGRGDGQVKIRGYRVELGEIEAVLRDCPGVRNGVIALVDGPTGQAMLAAYAVGEFDEAACRRTMARKLPGYMVPQQFIRLDALPLNPHGKIDRNALPAPTATTTKPQRSKSIPNDDAVRELVNLFSKTLGVADVGPDDDFFQIGGNSLLAVSLFERIRTRWSRSLPLAVLFEAPTPAQLAEVIRDETWQPDSPSLVTIQARGNRPPLFCVHGGGGHVLVYRDLALRLGTDQPMYGLQLPELSSGADPLSSLDVVARIYLREIRTTQPEGPYFLAGVSYGGVIAFEMARQLAAAGETVPLLIMFDTYAPGYPRYPETRHRLRDALCAAGYSLEHHLRGLQWLPAQQRCGYLTRLARRTLRRMAYPFKDLWRFAKRHCRSYTGHAVSLASYEAMRLALTSYCPETYNGNVLLFRAHRQPSGAIPDHTLGWSEWVEGQLDVVETIGYHADIITEPRLKFIIDALRERLHAAQSTDASRTSSNTS